MNHRAPTSRRSAPTPTDSASTRSRRSDTSITSAAAASHAPRCVHARAPTGCRLRVASRCNEIKLEMHGYGFLNTHPKKKKKRHHNIIIIRLYGRLLMSLRRNWPQFTHFWLFLERGGFFILLSLLCALGSRCESSVT